jgi:prepilin-type processing-associated H-X9-DG protein
VTLTLRDETSGSGSSGGGAGSSFGGGVGGSELTADAGGSATTNYGMNANYADVAGKAGKIAVMDYHRYQVRPDADVWSDPEIDPNADGIPVFARHWKKVNVLFTDGSVSLMDPKDIDPNVPSIEDKYWNP